MSRAADDLPDPDAAEAALAGLSLAAPPVEPPASLWERIAAGLAPKVPEGLDLGRALVGRWRTLAPGVEIRPLAGKRSFLIRCQPGAVVPRHRHRTFEHTLVLEGDIEGRHGPGEHIGTPAGWHEAWSTKGGCLALVQYE
jgi:anti-sigma factor ChrR (cupin superfamily)